MSPLLTIRLITLQPCLHSILFSLWRYAQMNTDEYFEHASHSLWSPRIKSRAAQNCSKRRTRLKTILSRPQHRHEMIPAFDTGSSTVFIQQLLDLSQYCRVSGNANVEIASWTTFTSEPLQLVILHMPISVTRACACS